MESFDYNVSVLAQRQKLLYDLTPQQQQQPFTSVEQPTYVVQEKSNTATPAPENLSKTDFEKVLLNFRHSIDIDKLCRNLIE